MRIALSVRILLAVLVLALVGVFGAPKAEAAWGCSWGNPWYGPSSYCVTVANSGNYVSYVSGSFSGSSFVCDWRITAEFFSLGWSWYQTLSSGTHWGCSTGGGDRINVYAWKYTGYVCSTLHYKNTPSGSWRRMSRCLSIGP